VLELNLCQYSNTFDWFVDNGASKQVAKNNKFLANIKDGKSTPKIKIASGTTVLT
jgi:hypothetical protein